MADGDRNNEGRETRSPPLSLCPRSPEAALPAHDTHRFLAEVELEAALLALLDALALLDEAQADAEAASAHALAADARVIGAAVIAEADAIGAVLTRRFPAS